MISSIPADGVVVVSGSSLSLCGGIPTPKIFIVVYPFFIFYFINFNSVFICLVEVFYYFIGHVLFAKNIRFYPAYESVPIFFMCFKNYYLSYVPFYFVCFKIFIIRVL